MPTESSQPSAAAAIFAFPGANPPAEALPLAHCQGDCDTDRDCGPGLICYQRLAPNEAVPGCAGGEEDDSVTDFCVFADTAPVPPPTSDTFRLRLNDPLSSSPNTEFCLDCENDCDSGDTLYLRTCSGVSTYFQFLDIGDSDEILIEAAEGLCLQRFSSFDIQLRPCDTQIINQRWTSNDSAFTDSQFQISQLVLLTRTCISQTEVDFFDRTLMRPCSEAVSDGTALWSKF